MESRLVDITNRIRVRVYQGGQGPELLYFHGAGGVFADDPFLAALARHFHVTAPLLPGFDDSEGAEHLRTMLDFTLFGLDCWERLQLKQPLLVGHSMGGMIAAEMAAIANTNVDRLVLISAAGLWDDDRPIEDLFAKLPFELPDLLFHEPTKHGALLSAGGDLDDPEFLTEFLVSNARRLGTAGKILFPIPDRGLAERLYRVRARTQVLWGQNDRLIPVSYGEQFAAKIGGATLEVVPAAGHMLPYESTDAVIAAINRLHNG
ncbi:MAG: alpha/beta hydrolase [Gammaproteobacteria bacterium]|nr:alpha/beta hydrolase [Gammaproteobacteria bacterium]